MIKQPNRYFTIKDTQGRDYYIASRDFPTISRFLLGPGELGENPRGFTMADTLGFKFDSLTEIGMAEARFAEYFHRHQKGGSENQDTFFLGYSVDPERNLDLRR